MRNKIKVRKQEEYFGTQESLKELIKDLSQGLTKRVIETDSVPIIVFADDKGGKLVIRRSAKHIEDAHITLETFTPLGYKDNEFKFWIREKTCE